MRVLVVEDDSSARDAISSVLEDGGYRVVCAPNGQVALDLLPRCLRGGELVVCDKGYVGAAFEAAVARLGSRVVRPERKDERPSGRPKLGRIRQRIESVFQTFKDILCLERHGARTPEGLRARVGVRILALAASVWLNHQLGRPSRSLASSYGTGGSDSTSTVINSRHCGSRRPKAARTSRRDSSSIMPRA